MISTEIINFINQTEEIFQYNNIDNIQTIYHYSIPNTKLFYPEPFIASASFMHSDLWFMHILIYQYWLWFVFIFIIVFFFITFMCTIRWCNMRIKPRKETRGVSRSKCGDLITACVPVSWAASIIINESTDAIDYFDGFGTTELVIGIRAYQWGWEYYYPKDLDLNYNLKKNYSTFLGNSLKYNKNSEINNTNNNLWKFYQNKNFDYVITPAHLLVLPNDNHQLLNFLTFNDIGSNLIYETNAFKKIKNFSKTYTNELFSTNNHYTHKFQKFSRLYNNDHFLENQTYGIKRQQNFLSNLSLLNNNTTFINLFSVNKLINFNFQFNNKIETNLFLINKKLNTFNENKINKLNNLIIKINRLINNKNIKTNTYFINFLINNSFINKINNNSDKKQLMHVINKNFNLFFKEKFIKTNINFINKINLFSDLQTYNHLNEINLNFKNKNSNTLQHSNFSNNQSIQLINKNIKNALNNYITTTNLNYTTELNALTDFFKNSQIKISSNELNFYRINNNHALAITNFNKLSTTKINFDYPYSPIPSNNSFISFLNYDSFSNSYIDNSPNILQSKEESIPTFLPNIYWNFYHSISNFNWRINNNTLYFDLLKKFTFPTFFFYYDYDFRNWQSLELLEDSYWESTYSIYTLDEYLNLFKDFYSINYTNKYINYFFNLNKLFKNNNYLMDKPFFFNQQFLGEFYSLPLYVDDFSSPTFFIKSKNFIIYSILYNFLLTEDNYENLKFLIHYFNNTNNYLMFFSKNNFSFLNEKTVLNYFRSDFDEFTWFFDENNFFFTNTINFKNFKNIISCINTNFQNDKNSFFFFTENLNNQLTKFNNYINLRNTTKNSIVTYNAIQKVFRTRFDENRSHSKLIDFSHSTIAHPFITSNKIPFEKLLGKNKNNFFEIITYKSNFKSFFNNTYANITSLNFYFYDFPFLLALKSDASRYLWFDWFAKWGFYEVQPSSSSRYALYGMPYFSKNFEFNSLNNENLLESETYLTRIAKARKNYLSNWQHTPFFFAKNNNWYKNNWLFNILNNTKNNLTNTKFLLISMKWYWTELHILNYSNLQFLPSNSNTNSFTRASWKPQTSFQTYYYNINNLIDILTKREYLYREFFFKTNKIINLPMHLTSNPSNNLITEIKSNFLFNNLTNTYQNFSKNIFYNSLIHFDFLLTKTFLYNSINFFNINFFLNNLFYFFNFKELTTHNLINNESFKNQFKPMRKGITNMIRLHATGAMALPIEIRLQLLASSKDVIHSWAIPSAGIKIDCVPGYSSHRVMIFLVSGIFWGQCMEICGRYHHWMPIVVYFMKRDLFFLWCTHFIFLSGTNNTWNINDRQFTNYSKLVSFDKNSWLSELNF